jgi:hypothetical protein
MSTQPFFGIAMGTATAREQDETYFTEKTCKCGRHLVIRYVLTNHGDQIDAAEGGHFRCGNRWPNYVYCGTCQRRHDLTKFIRLDK